MLAVILISISPKVRHMQTVRYIADIGSYLAFEWHPLISMMIDIDICYIAKVYIDNAAEETLVYPAHRRMSVSLSLVAARRETD